MIEKLYKGHVLLHFIFARFAPHILYCGCFKKNQNYIDYLGLDFKYPGKHCILLLFINCQFLITSHHHIWHILRNLKT